MNAEYRSNLIDYIINLHRSNLYKDINTKHKKYLEKYRMHLERIEQNQLNEATAKYRNYLLTASDEQLSQAKEDCETDEFFAGNDEPDYSDDPYDYDPHYYDGPEAY